MMWIEGIAPSPVRDSLERTLQQISDWQRAHGLAPDGLIGAATWQARDAALVVLADRFELLCEAVGATHLETYRRLRVLRGR